MEKEKIVKITDMGTDKYFKVRLFSALEGLEFFDKFLSYLGKDKEISVRPFLNDLFKLCAAMDGTGEMILIKFGEFTTQKACAIFENPLAVLELGKKILEHQEVFIKDSETFQKLKKTALGKSVF